MVRFDQVVPEQVEEVCHGEHLVHQGHTGRFLVLGPTRAGRLLAVVLDPEGDDVYYVVTARSADRKERRIYQREKGGTSP